MKKEYIAVFLIGAVSSIPTALYGSAGFFVTLVVFGLLWVVLRRKAS